MKIKSGLRADDSEESSAEQVFGQMAVDAAKALSGNLPSGLVEFCRQTLAGDLKGYLEHLAPYAAKANKPVREFVKSTLLESSAEIPFHPGLPDTERGYVMALCLFLDDEVKGAEMMARNLQRAHLDGVGRALTPLILGRASDHSRLQEGNRKGANRTNEKYEEAARAAVRYYQEIYSSTAPAEGTTWDELSSQISGILEREGVIYVPSSVEKALRQAHQVGKIAVPAHMFGRGRKSSKKKESR